MRSLALRSVLLLVAIGVCVSAHALAVISVYEYGTTNEYAVVAPGGTVHLVVHLDLSDDDLDSMRYDLAMPSSTWVMTDRTYGAYGWLVNDGFMDASNPKETATFPVTITEALYAGDPGEADFHFETGRPFGSPLTPGTYTVEDFWLQVPGDFSGTQYMNMRNLLAYEPEFGSPIDTLISTEAFEFTNAVPEPASLAFMALGLCALAVIRRRRMS